MRRARIQSRRQPRCRWEWQAVNPARAERGRKAVRGLFLDGRVHVAKGVRRPPWAVLRSTFRTPSQGFSEEGNDGWLCAGLKAER
jgi:hypothetical protein